MALPAAASLGTDSVAVTSQQASTSGKPWQNLRRTSEFWTRATNVYAKYKIAQVRRRSLTAATPSDRTPKQSGLLHLYKHWV